MINGIDAVSDLRSHCVGQDRHVAASDIEADSANRLRITFITIGAQNTASLPPATRIAHHSRELAAGDDSP